MLLAAQLSALTVIVANLLRTEPGVTNKAGNRVLLDTKSRHHEGVDHIVGSGDDANLLTHRHNHRVVYLEQVIDGGLGHITAVRHGAMAAVQSGDEGQPFALSVEIVVAPLPLVTSGLDGQVGIGGIFLGYQHLGGGQCHQDDDDEGDDGPDDFHRHRLMEVGRLCALGFAMLPDGIEHHREHSNEDHRADDQHHPMQKVLLFRNFGDWRGQVQLVDRRASGQVLNGMGGAPKPCTGHQQQRSQLIGNALHSSHLLLSLKLTNPRSACMGSGDSRGRAGFEQRDRPLREPGSKKQPNPLNYLAPKRSQEAAHRIR